MLSRLINPKTLFGKIFLSTATLFFLFFLVLFSGTTYLLKMSTENDFKRKADTEAELVSSYVNSLLKNYNYEGIYFVLKKVVKNDPDIVGISVKEFSSPLLEVKEPVKLKRCEKDLFTPCYFTVVKELKLSIPIKVEVSFSTEKLANLVSSIRNFLSIFLFILFGISELLVYLIIKKGESSVNEIVEAIDSWKKGGLKRLEGKEWSLELQKIVSEVLEMYNELEKEQEIDRKLLFFTKEVLNVLVTANSEEEFLKGIIPSLKALFKFKDLKLCKKCKGERVITITPEMKLIIADGVDLPETVLETIGNIISGALKVVGERKEKEELLFGTVRALANAIDATSQWTRGHSERVAEISVEIGKALGLSEEEIEKLKLGALLHDIGKLGVPPEILDKPEKLTPEEYEIVKEHPAWGYRILKPVRAFQEIIPIVLYHHERCNGTGYPEGLKCDQIPLLAKIVAVADVIEAMTAERPYKKAYPVEEVFEYLKREKGRLFSPEVVEAALSRAEEIRRIISESGRGGGI